MKHHEILAKHFDNILIAGNVPFGFRDVIFTYVKRQLKEPAEKLLKERILELKDQVIVMEDVLKQIGEVDERIWVAKGDTGTL
jgi:predicted phosphatase